MTAINKSAAIITSIRMIEDGLVPVCKDAAEFYALLNSLPPAEKKKAQRKFRKVWRKCRAIELIKVRSKDNFDKHYGTPGETPTLEQKRRRVRLVWSHYSNFF